MPRLANISQTHVNLMTKVFRSSRCCLVSAVLILFAVLPGIGAALAQHVVIIGIDGMKGEAAINAKTPNMHRMMKEGAYTLQARAVIPFVSKPNWSTMIMGAPPELTGVTSNDWMPDKFKIAPVCKDAAGIFPTIFGILRQQDPSATIGVFTDWAGFATLVEPKAPNVMKVTDENQDETTQQVISFIEQSRPTLTFVHYDCVDDAGHTYGWDTPQYYAQVTRVDGFIGKIEKALKQAGILKQTVILVTADHGGRGTRHGQNIMPDVLIPWIISGPGIRRGVELKNPVNQFDTAATIAYILNLKPPVCWIGKPVIEAFASR